MPTGMEVDAGKVKTLVGDKGVPMKPNPIHNSTQ
jgi:hypothetical protein